MVRFNGKDFKLYDLDTVTSVTKRLASELNTLPKYLYFSNGNPTREQLYSDADIHVENLLEILKEDITLPQMVEKIKNKYSELNIISDILDPYIAYRDEQLNENIIGLIYNPYIENSEFFTDKKRENIPIDAINIWNDRNNIKQNIRSAINSNKEKSRQEVMLFNEFETTGGGINYTEFELENIRFDIRLDLINISLLEIFNNIKLNKTIPFASVNDFFKILKDFIPHPDWSVSLESAIVLKILEKIDTSNPKLSDFTDAFIQVEGNPGEEVVLASLDLSATGANVSREDFINRFLGSLSSMGTINIRDTRESHIRGVFYFPSHSLNNYVFSDMVMNNPLFSYLLSIDESIKATKKKQGLYIHFNHPRIGYVTATITEKVMEKSDATMKGKSLKVFPLNERYIRVKISRAQNIDTVREFQNILSKIFIIYNNNYDQIVEEYKKFIPNFGEIEPIKKQKTQKISLKNIEPEIFLSNYTRQCPKKPTIVDDKTAEEALEARKQVMVFPIHNEGPQPRNYICDHKKHKYPGLRVNPLANNELFPFIPCCYAKDQVSREGSRYRHYYYGEDLPSQEISQQDFYTTNKFAPHDKFGTLPQNISKMFELVDPDEKYIFVRKGVHRNKSSFLNCVMEALNINNILGVEDVDERRVILTDTREYLASLKNASACRQEMYDFTTEEIVNLISNSEVYLDPKLFLHLLEVEYNCNIFIFTRQHINGEMTLPRHLQSYYKMRREKKCVFIFEHMGSESDHAEYPQCELIVRWEVKNVENLEYNFEYNSPVAIGVRQVFETLRKSYALNKFIQEDYFPWTGKSVPVSQIIDSYGKLRRINIKFKNKTLCLFTSPIQPVNILETRDTTIIKIDISTALKFAASINMIITKQSIINGVVKEIFGIIGNVDVIIPINNGSPIESVPDTQESISYSNDYISAIEEYNHNKKIARYISEYLFWLFSKYINDNNIENITEQDITTFTQNNILINKDFNYTYVKKTFSTISGLMHNKKLIVKSEEILKRLLYVLRLTIIRYPEKLQTYYTRNVIEQYYVDITDFDQHVFQVVMEGEKSVEKWIQEKKIKYNLRNDINIGVFTPYFFKNDLISKQVFLAQNTDSFLKGITIATTWFRDNYNPGSDVEKSDRVAFTLYSYESPTDIIKYSVTGDESPYDIKMIGYKIEDNNFFTVLLPLE